MPHPILKKCTSPDKLASDEANYARSTCLHPHDVPARSHTFVEIDQEIISTAILPLPLIQEGLLSVTSESMCTKYWLTA